MPAKKYQVKESDIQRQCLQWLQLHHVFARRWNSGMAFWNGRAAKMGEKGDPDIWILHRGRFIAIEVKAQNKHQSREQIIRETEIRNAGGQYYVVRRLEDLIGAMA